MAKVMHYAEDNLPMVMVWSGLAVWIAVAAMKAMH